MLYTIISPITIYEGSNQSTSNIKFEFETERNLIIGDIVHINNHQYAMLRYLTTDEFNNSFNMEATSEISFTISSSTVKFVDGKVEIQAVASIQDWNYIRTCSKSGNVFVPRPI